MLVYFDNCAIQRPIDDKTDFRVRVEAEAMLSLLELTENGYVEIVSSVALLYELNKTPDPERIEYGMHVLSLSKKTLPLTKSVVDKAKLFEKMNIKPIDALHLAFSVLNEIDYLCTCDDRFIRRAKEIKKVITKAILPTDLIREIQI